jgi:Protein of unknown function (DUF1700).
MNKYEYIYLLKNNLSIYEGNIEEIIQNYENIIDEMLDEGLSMDDISRRLGSPAVLADEIAEELQLKHNQEYYNQTATPQWTKILLLICGIVLFIPGFSFVVGLIGAIFGFILAIIGLIFGGLVGSFSIWFVPTIPFALKMLGTVLLLSIVVSVSIALYFAIYGMLRLIMLIIRKIKELFTGGKRGVLQ